MSIFGRSTAPAGHVSYTPGTKRRLQPSGQRPSASSQVAAFAVWAMVWTLQAVSTGETPYALAGLAAMAGFIALVQIGSVRRVLPKVPGSVVCVLAYFIAIPLLLSLDTRSGLTSAEFSALVSMIVFPVLGTDWRDRKYLLGAVLMSIIPVSSALGWDEPVVAGTIAAWCLALVLALALLQRDRVRATADFATDVVDEHRPLERRTLASVARVIAVLAVLLVIALQVVPPRDLTGNRGHTTPGPGRANPTYSALGTQMDTSARIDELSDEVVLRVEAEAPDFLRAKSYSDFDGRVWFNEDERAVIVEQDGSGWAYPQQGWYDEYERRMVDPTQRRGGHQSMTTVPAPGVVFDELIQNITVVIPGDDSVFGAYSIQSVYSPDSPLRFDVDSSQARFARVPGADSRYEVRSRRALATEALLRANDPLTVEGPFREQFTEIRDGALSDRARTLAHEITADAPTTYDKIRAIEQWLGDNVEYTLDIPPLPDGQNTIDQFLFVDRAGFCQQIASTLAMMLRELGVPTRVATGYVPGEPDPFTHEYDVPRKNAHAWVEVYFPGIGWQGFDPTAEVPLAGEVPVSTAADRLRDRWLLVGTVVLIAVVVVIIATIPALRARWARRSRRRGDAGEPPAGDEPERLWALAMTDRLQAAARTHGRPRAPAETVIEIGDALAEEPLAGSDARFRDVGRILSRALFGTDPGTTSRVSPEDVALVEATIVDLEARPAPKRERDRQGSPS